MAAAGGALTKALTIGLAASVGLMASPFAAARPSDPPRDALAISVTQPLIYAPMYFPRPSIYLWVDPGWLPLYVRVTNQTDKARYIPRDLQGLYSYNVNDELGRHLEQFYEPPRPLPTPPGADGWIRLEPGMSRTFLVQASVSELGLDHAGTYNVVLTLTTLSQLGIPGADGPFSNYRLSIPFHLSVGGDPGTLRSIAAS